jgi:PPOX class probable F420-dependent enzyme
MDAKGFAHLATLRADGSPRTSPVWYDWDGTYVLVSHTKGRQKYKDVQRDPRVALSILDPDNPYRYIEIRGSVEIEDDPNKTLINTLAKKYQGRDTYGSDGPGDDRVIFKIAPERVVAYG